MAQSIFGADFAVSALNRALLNSSPSNAIFNSQKGTAGNTDASQFAYAGQMAAQFASKTDAEFSKMVLTNMGVLPSTVASVQALEGALADYLGVAGKANRGIVVLQLSAIMASLETATGDLAVYNAAAVKWNKEVTASYQYSSNAANTSAFNGDFPEGNPSDGQTYTLKTTDDTFNGGDGNDLVRGVAGTVVGNQDQPTLNSGDVLKGGAGADTLILLLNGAYGGGATIRDFETLQLGTNNAVATFDYNVNQGAYEITGTDTIVYDQITAGEALTVNNVTPTADGDKAPELVWANEAGSNAGTIGTTYRQAAITGNADNQNVTLKNVNALANGANGQLNIGAGMESITITSTGTVANNTLNASANVDAAGANGNVADIISAGSLGKVILKGDVAIGKTGGVVAAGVGGQGLTDRIVGADIGFTPFGTPSDSNLLSVGSRVTEVDASEMTGAANVRFVAKTNGTATNVTFKGGKGSDYVEFELGNVTATGGEGDDTFAFLNAGANSTFGEGDKIDGGAGADTIQLGLNGNGVYNVSETELRNKTSIETLDLRGNVNNLTLSSDFVAASGTPGTVTVRTDKIVQTSAADAANAVGNANNVQENNATSTIDLTKLSSSQGVNFMGGSGSDRIILNDAAFNVQQMLDGGTPSVDTNILAGANRYDTITVTTTGGNVVIDAADLSNVKNFEGLVLTKNSAAATYNITLTRNFLNANTQAADNANTGILDTNFQIGTSNAANNSALAAGDTVTIDVRDLLNAADNGRAGGFTVRTFDITALENAGVTVVFLGNTGNLTAAAVRAAGVLVANGADANWADVVVNSAANPAAAAAGRTLVLTGVSGNTTSGFEVQGNQLATAQNDTIVVNSLVLNNTAVLNGSGGQNTLQVRDGANISAATLLNVTNLTFDATGVVGTNDLTLSQAQNNAFTGTVTAAGTGVNGERITITDAGAVTALAGIENYSLSSGGANNITVNAATTGVNLNGAAGNAKTVTIAGNTVTGGWVLANGADVIVATDGANIAGVNGGAVTTAELLTLTGGITMTAAQYNAINAADANITAGGGADSVTLTTSAAVAANSRVESYILNGAGNDTLTISETNNAALTDGVRATMSVNLAGGGADRVVLNNGAINNNVNSAVTITGFGADDVLQLSAGAASTSNGLFYNDVSAFALGNVASGSVIEIDAAAFQVGVPTNTASVLGFVTTAGLVGAANAAITVVAYNGTGQAAIYQLEETTVGGGTAFDTIELIAVVNAANNSLAAGNFA